jgi:hypothetical protein
VTKTTEHFTVEESLALLRAIFPNYPDTRNPKAVPNPEEWLAEYRRTHPHPEPKP